MLQIHKIVIRNGEEVDTNSKGEDELFLTIATRYRKFISPGTGEVISQLTMYYVNIKVVRDSFEFKSVRKNTTEINKAYLNRN